MFVEKYLCWRLFNKVTGLKACNFVKKRLQHGFFPVNIAELLKKAFYRGSPGKIEID